MHLNEKIKKQLCEEHITYQPLKHEQLKWESLS
jgi:Cdc6-like AAA superfamily ATPase